MKELKPKLIVAGSHKKKGGFASGMGYFLILILVFVLGVYVGTRVDDPKFGGEKLIGITQDDASLTQNTSNESQEVIVEVSQEKQTDGDGQNISSESASIRDTNRIKKQSDGSNSEISSLDESENVGDPQELDNAFITGSNESTTELNNESAILELDPVVADLNEEDTYRLQVAAFGNFDHANEAANELKLKGYDAYIVTTSNSRGEVWNLVKVGKFKTALEAWNFLALYQTKEGGEVSVESLNSGRVFNESLEENNTEE